MIDRIMETEFGSVPSGHPYLIQGSLLGLLLEYRIKKNLLIQSIIDFLLYTKKSPYLVFPGFTFGVFNTLKYNSCQSPEIGYISDYVFNIPGVIRTSHPMYSFLIIKNKEYSFDLNINSDRINCFGTSSFYNELVAAKAIQICMGVSDSKCMTFYHHAEHICGAEHRFDKIFSVDTLSEIRKVIVYVRRHGVITDVSGMENLMWENKIWNGDSDLNTKGVRWCHLKECLSFVQSLPSDKYLGNLYRN